MRSYLQQHSKNNVELIRVFGREPRVEASHDFFEQTFHVTCSEGWLERNGFIKYTSQRPDIRFFVIGQILPDFRTRVIRCACLGLAHALHHLRNVQIPQLHHPILRQKHVRTLQITMQDFHIMKNFQPSSELDEYTPHLSLRKPGLLFLMLFYTSEQVTIIRVLHDNTGIR